MAEGTRRFVAASIEPIDPSVDGVVEFARDVGAALQDNAPRIGLALAIVAVGWLLSLGLRVVLRAWFRHRRRTPSFAVVMSRLAGWILLTLAVLAGIAVAFPSVRPVDLLASLGFFSVAVGFAFRDILENTLAGVLLLLRQSFRSGDQIRVQGESGTVEAITIRDTRLVTFDGELVLIPNRDVYKSVLAVPTHFRTRRMTFRVGVAYENDAREACDVVTAAIRDVADVVHEPAPETLVHMLGVSTVELEVRLWTHSRQLDATRVVSEALLAAKSALDEAGIEMPADIVALQATPSLKAALQGDGDVTPGGALARDSAT